MAKVKSPPDPAAAAGNAPAAAPAPAPAGGAAPDAPAGGAAPAAPPGTSSNGTPSPGGGGTAGGTAGGTTAAATQLDPASISALIDILRTGVSPSLAQSRDILLRRLALEGDVVPSRVPPPRNITEIGGYINLLEDRGQTVMESQVLAGILGVAGPNPLGTSALLPPLSLVSLSGDRPDGPAQAAIPLSFLVRSDFSAALQSSIAALNAQGCHLPLLSPPQGLPAGGPGVAPPADLLAATGRVLYVVPAAALSDPANDLIVLAAAAPGGPYRVMAGTQSAAVAPANWFALAAAGGAISETQVAVRLVDTATALSAAGFYSAKPLPAPATPADTAWARLTNITGLVAGVTRLGDELALLYQPADIAASSLATRLAWVWNGTAFAAPA